MSATEVPLPGAPASQPAERRLGGPTATGSGWRRIAEITWINAVADFQTKYAGSTLGYLWTLVRPLSLFAILYVVVTQIFGRFETVPDYGSMLLFNIVLFIYYSEAVTNSTRALVMGGLIRKTELPVVAMPFATVLSSTFTFATNMFVVIVWILIAGVEPQLGWLMFPVIVAAIMALTVGTSLLVSAAWVRHRDVAQLWPSVSRLLFYASPILFPLEAVPDGALSDLQSINPLAPILAQARVWIIDPEAVGWFTDRSTLAAVLPFIIGALICVAGIVLFKRRARTAGEEV